jgi:hypothetical protein
MDPKVWGPHAWTFLHLSALHADRSNGRTEWKSLMNAMVLNLPCEECKKHASVYWASHEYQPSESAFEWTHRFHNTVNVRLHKPEVPLAKAFKEWDHEHCNLQCTQSPEQNVLVSQDSKASTLFLGALVVSLLLYGAFRWSFSSK